MSGTLPQKVWLATKALATRRVTMQFDRVPFEFEDVPLAKILNWIRVEASVSVKPGRPWGQPTHLQIEPSSVCNLRCPVCPVVTGLGRSAGLMDVELFKRIIDECCGSVFLISLWGWGEPLVHPRIHDMVAYARSKGIAVITSTNGHTLMKPGQVDRLIESGLDVLIVAVDGATQETYGRYRRPGDLASVLDGVRLLAERRRELGATSPRIDMRMVVMKHNEHEVQAMITVARAAGADMFSLKTMNPLTHDPYGLDPSPQIDSDDHFIPSNPRYQRFRYEADGKTRIRVEDNPCRRLWNNPEVQSDGVVCTCSSDVSGRLATGDLNRQSLGEIWASPTYRQARVQFRTDWEKRIPCCTCTYAYAGGSCVDELIPDLYVLTPGGGAPGSD